MGVGSSNHKKPVGRDSVCGGAKLPTRSTPSRWRIGPHLFPAGAFLLASTAAAGAAYAQGGESGAGGPSPDRWTFQVTPYAWAASLNGDVRLRPQLPTVDVDASFDDLLDHLDGALMLWGEARYGRYSLLLDVDYLDISASGSTPGQLFGDADATSKAWIATAGFGYRVLEQPEGFVDLMAGARLWSLDNELDFSAGRLPATSASEDQTWIDPLIGLRAHLEFGPGMFVSSAADLGGFGIGSTFTWQIFATVGYHFNETVAIEAGYRHLSVDYDDDGFLWDVDLSGPIIGMSFRF
jgi:hypothetical protein